MLFDQRWQLDDVGCVLWAAADYIEEHGLARRTLSDSYGRVCVAGAIMKVSSVETRYQAVDRFRGHVGCKNIGDWNDFFCADKDEATAALRAAAVTEL